MPELPDVTVYLECLERRVVGQTLRGIRLGSPFVLRSVQPKLTDAEGKRVDAVRRLGKRIVLGLEDDLFLVIHLMIAGRLRWRAPGAKLQRKLGLAAFDFPEGTLVLTEAGSRKRASLHLVLGESELSRHDPGGLDVMTADLDAFRKALTRESHTLKRTLTDPRQFSGIGNAYSDEILHRARLSPFKKGTRLSSDESKRLYTATRETLREWTERLRAKVGDGFPEKVTAFHDEMAVHGRYRKPCPICGSPIQRIVYANNEANYCATCQTGGKVLADNTTSKFLK